MNTNSASCYLEFSSKGIRLGGDGAYGAIDFLKWHFKPAVAGFPDSSDFFPNFLWYKGKKVYFGAKAFEAAQTRGGGAHFIFDAYTRIANGCAEARDFECLGIQLLTIHKRLCGRLKCAKIRVEIITLFSCPYAGELRKLVENAGFLVKGQLSESILPALNHFEDFSEGHCLHIHLGRRFWLSAIEKSNGRYVQTRILLSKYFSGTSLDKDLFGTYMSLNDSPRQKWQKKAELETVLTAMAAEESGAYELGTCVLTNRSRDASRELIIDIDSDSTTRTEISVPAVVNIKLKCEPEIFELIADGSMVRYPSEFKFVVLSGGWCNHAFVRDGFKRVFDRNVVELASDFRYEDQSWEGIQSPHHEDLVLPECESAKVVDGWEKILENISSCEIDSDEIEMTDDSVGIFAECAIGPLTAAPRNSGSIANTMGSIRASEPLPMRIDIAPSPTRTEFPNAFPDKPPAGLFDPTVKNLDENAALQQYGLSEQFTLKLHCDAGLFYQLSKKGKFQRFEDTIDLTPYDGDKTFDVFLYHPDKVHGSVISASMVLPTGNKTALSYPAIEGRSLRDVLEGRFVHLIQFKKHKGNWKIYLQPKEPFTGAILAEGLSFAMAKTPPATEVLKMDVGQKMPFQKHAGMDLGFGTEANGKKWEGSFFAVLCSDPLGEKVVKANSVSNMALCLADIEKNRSIESVEVVGIPKVARAEDVLFCCQDATGKFSYQFQHSCKKCLAIFRFYKYKGEWKIMAVGEPRDPSKIGVKVK